MPRPPVIRGETPGGMSAVERLALAPAENSSARVSLSRPDAPFSLTPFATN